MQELYQWLALPVEYQPVFTTLIMGSAMGGLTWALRDVPLRVWWWVRSQFVSYCEYTEFVSSGNRAFSERASTLLVWLAKNSYTWTTRAFRIPGEQDGVRGLQVTGSRPFFFMHEGKFYWAQVFERGLDMGVSYTVRVSTFGRNNKMEQLNDFLVSIGVFQSVAKDTVEVTTYRNSGHFMSPSYTAQPKRDLESVFIPGNSKELLCKEFETFISNRSWRLEHSRPDKRCVMLEGPPGTGKSSLALALASHYDLKLVTISMESATMDGLTTIVRENRVGELPTLLLMEDVDYCQAVWSREYTLKVEKESGERLSTPHNSVKPGELLNFLSGVVGLDNVIILITTNRPEILDPAFVRPGRIDLRVHIPKFDAQCGLEFTEYHYPELKGCVTLSDFEENEYTGAELSWLLDRYQSDADAFLRGVRNGERPEVVGGAYEGMFVGSSKAA